MFSVLSAEGIIMLTRNEKDTFLGIYKVIVKLFLLIGFNSGFELAQNMSSPKDIYILFMW